MSVLSNAMTFISMRSLVILLQRTDACCVAAIQSPAAIGFAESYPISYRAFIPQPTFKHRIGAAMLMDVDQLQGQASADHSCIMAELPW